jgi:hypothetical protein
MFTAFKPYLKDFVVFNDSLVKNRALHPE